MAARRGAPGLTVRQYYMHAAIQGLASRGDLTMKALEHEAENVARVAAAIADAAVAIDTDAGGEETAEEETS